MSVLVTGGAGYIGSHTCVALLAAEEEVVVVDNFVNSSPEAVRRIERIAGKPVKLYEADILDAPALEKIFAENDIESVIHFAGLKAVGESVQVPLRYYRNNITGTLTLCEAMAAAGCKRIVFSSSATVYGMSDDVPFRETHPLLPATNPYGATKAMIETILKDLYISDNGWSVALLRYFNPIGAHESGLLGEDPAGIPNNLLPYICRVAAGKLPHLNIYGNDYDTPDGTGVRDYLHVVDLAAGHLDALRYVRGRTGVEAVNLGTGNGYSVVEVMRAFERACGKPIPHKFVDRRPGDIATCYADASKAQELFGWKAARDIEEMCRDSWNFIQKNPDGM